MHLPKNIEKSFRVVRLEEADVRKRTDDLVCLRDLILANEPMYPGIGQWVNGKVLPGLRSSERVAFVGYLDEKPVVSAVVKRGTTAKFCHLRIADELQNAHLGEVFFALMANEVRDLASDVYCTLPESLWATKKQFFQSFHFTERTKASTQYRLWDEELHCRASFADVWRSVAEKLPKILEVYSPGAASTADNLLLSIQPQHVAKILQGKKRIELRRRFSTRWLGQVVNLYATGQVKQLMGQARVKRIVVRAPELIWEEFQGEIGCSRQEFDRYTAEADEVYAVELDEVTAFRVPVSRAEASALVRDRLVPPQSYCSLANHSAWAKAVSFASFLQGAFHGSWTRSGGSNPSASFGGRVLSTRSRVMASQVSRMFA